MWAVRCSQCRYPRSGPANVDGYAAARVKRTEPLDGGGLGKPRIEPVASGNDEGTDLMSRRVLVDHGELVPKPEVEVCRDDVDVASQTEARRCPFWDSDHVLFGLWLANNSAESHAADDHRRRHNGEEDQHGSRGTIRATAGNPHPGSVHDSQI